MGNVQPLWAECPAITRFIIAAYPCTALCFKVLGAIMQQRFGPFLACSLHAVAKYRIWTLLSSLVYTQIGGGLAILFVLFELYMVLQHFHLKEKELGSFSFVVWLFLANMINNCLFLAMMLLVTSVAGPSFLYFGSNGMWPMIVFIMSQRMLGDMDGATSFWGVVQIPNKWYPLLFVAFFSLINETVLFNLVAPLLLGYMGYYSSKLNLDRLLPSQAALGALEQRIFGQHVQSRLCLGGAWVAAGAGSYGPAGSTVAPSVWGAQMQERPAARTVQFTAFSGEGNRLGDGTEDQEEEEHVDPRTDV